MIVPDQIELGKLYLHNNGWTVAKAINIYDGETGKFITVESFDEQHDIPLDAFCQRFNEIVVPNLGEE